MAKYQSDSIKNIALLGHSGDGKTALAEAMLLLAGAIDRVGGNLDFDPEEKKRGSSIAASLAAFEWKGKKINLLDTPGYFDFAGEVKQALRVADTAVLVVDGKSGFKVGTELAWDYSDGVSKCFFVNKTDDENANFDNVLNGLKDQFGSSVCPVIVPCQAGKATSYCNLITGEAFEYDAKGNAKKVAFDASAFEDYYAALKEVLAETDEELMEKFFGDEDFTKEEMINALRVGLKDGSVVPVFSGSATAMTGISTFLDVVADSFKSAADRTDDAGTALSASGDTALLCFKSVADAFGKKSFFRVMNGNLKKDTQLTNLRSEQGEKIARIYTCVGAKESELDELVWGDIGYTTKLVATNTGDTLGGKEAFAAIDFPKPYYRQAIVPKSKGDEDKISTGIAKLLEEDPTIKYENNAETKQMLVHGLGDIHLDVVASKLKSRYGVSIEYSEPKTAYRETIKKTYQAEGKHKKQSGGSGQYGHVKITFSHGEEDGLTFTQSVVGGSVPKNFYPAVEKGLLEAMQKGVLAGFPVVNLAADLFDGSYHPVDSNEISFKLAAILAYKQTVNANPIILEPVGYLKVLIPTSYSGDIMGDVSKRRGRIMGMGESDRKGYTVIEAEIPSAEMNNYAIQLRAMTQG
ncbi:MAG: elongation factor G, partial [Clostridia bacterium]|nr:elongation factor G [Clostridia bacterium]